jgi:hypothetical protein
MLACAVALCVLLAVSRHATAELPASVPAGTWKFNGDSYEGDLILEVKERGKISGTVYGNQISGMYHAATKRLNFIRMGDPQDPTSFQAYKGYLFRNTDGDKVRYTLAGTFYPTDLAKGSADAVPEMGWFAQITVGDAPPPVSDKSTPSSDKSTPRKLATLPRQFDLRPQFLKFGLTPRSQEARNTCSVFVTAGALEFALSKHLGRSSPLSVEYLNWASNQIVDNTTEDRGHFFHDLLKGFEQHGVCLETEMPYVAKFDPQLKPSETATEHAKEIAAKKFKVHWINPWKKDPGLSESQLREIKEVLASGWPVAAGSSHSLLLVGYVNDLKQPGGGTFITKDSGKAAFDTVTYEFAKSKIGDVFWVEAPPKPKAK